MLGHVRAWELSFGDHLTDPPNATYCPFHSLPGRSCSQKLPASPSKALASPGNTETLGEAPIATSSPSFSMPLLYPSSSFRPTQRSLSHPTPSFLLMEPYHLTHHLSWLLSSPSAFYLTTPRATKALTEPPHTPPPPPPNSQPYIGLWN